MFRRYKKDEGAPNRLIDEAEPNKLTWTSADGTNAEPFEPAGSEDFEDERGDGDTDDELDARTAAERAAALQAELDREAEEFGLTGQNPTEMYGPNGEDVASLLDSLADIDHETAEAIADAYEAVPEAERKVAQSVVRRRHRGGGRESELWAAEHAVSDWLAALQLDGDEFSLYSVVADAATDAVDALVLEDDLADVDFATLYGPWSEVMDAEEEGGSEGDEADEADEAAPAKGSGTKKAAPAEAAAEEAEDEGEFGPNTELVLQFLTRLAALTAAETSELVVAWRKQPKEELRIAHRNLQALADEDPKWREQLRLAQEEVFAWMAGRSEKRDYSFGAPQSLARVREPAGPAVADAVAALAMADMLEQEDAETLYAPWADVVKEPALPEYEDDDSR
ncbi:MAG: hypothetical protein ABSD62_03825 [Candidatus Limnocylindrales bacterium]|jgi:hypothetical protein